MKLLVFIIGSILASFCNVVVNRKIKEESIVYPPSHCDECGNRLGILDLIPILSFVFLKGECRYCKAKIPIDNLIMEISGGTLALLCFNPDDITKSIILFLASLLALVIAMIDLKTFDIYLSQVFILGAIGTIYRYVYLDFDKDFLIKILIFIISYGLIYFISKGGLGDGDIYYYLALALFIENQNILWFILISIWLGAIGGILIAINKKSTKLKIPFCIYIFLSFVISSILELSIL